MRVLVAVVALVSLHVSLPALAMSPWEAAELARDIGRPTSSYIKLQDQHLLHPEVTSAPTKLFAPGGAPMGIFLNAFGGRYTCGNDDASQNISSVVCGGNAGTVGPFSLPPSAWTAVMNCVQEQFAPFNTFVTDVEPTSGEYVEAVVGGTPDQAGMPQGVGGVAPFTCGVIPGAVVYAFSDVYGNDPQGICETIAQEVAHAFGLDHELLCEDPMTYLSGCGAKSFQDQYASCGEFEPRQCSCDIPNQNSVQMMLERLGSNTGEPPPPPPDDHEDPTAEIISPDDGDVLQANSTITVQAEVDDDTQLSVVELEWDFSGEAMFCPGNGGAWNCDRSGTTATWTIQVGEGARTFRVHVRDIAGKEATTADRTIYLTPDGVTPPDDVNAPSVIVLTPRGGAILPANSQLDVIALVGDDKGLSSVELEWPFNQGVFACPMQSDGITCVVDGDVYHWTLQVGEGERPFRVRAVDDGGNVKRTEEFTITLIPNAPVPAEDGNDLPGDAIALACGEEVDLDGSDADWVDVDAPEGQEVSVVVDGAGASLVATDASGTSVTADGHDELGFTSEGTTKVAVLPDLATGGGYTVSVVCDETKGTHKGRGGVKTPALAGCAQTGGAAAVPFGALLLVLGLRRRRR